LHEIRVQDAGHHRREKVLRQDCLGARSQPAAAVLTHTEVAHELAFAGVFAPGFSDQ
jgi:hypothetical protein